MQLARDHKDFVIASSAAGRPSALARPDLDAALARSADRYRVATSYTDQAGRPVQVSADTLRAVLAALRPEPRGSRPHRNSPPGPPVVVRRAGASTAVELATPPGTRVCLRLESGETRQVATREHRLGCTALLPGTLPVGWHQLEVSAVTGAQHIPVAIAPYRLAQPARGWGIAVQLYATRSAACWGVGDFGDLATLAGQAAGADFLLVNPLHAAATVAPLEPSPYTPGSRRFLHPIYLRITDLAAYRNAPAELRAEVDACRPQPDPAVIDRDRTWAGLQAGLRLLWQRTPQADLSQFRATHDGVDQFAIWCVLAAEHGRDYRCWPATLRRPDSPAVAAVGRDRAGDVDFHVWCQLLAEEQLAAAQKTARRSGMRIGVLHDLPVGVDPGGPDAWALQDMLVPAMTIGAPPDEFNQQGQDWGLPPWHPQALRAAGYRPFAQLVRSALSRGGGLRVDHVLGLFRLWVIPAGAPPAEGTYLRYPAEELLGVLTLEASRAAAVVIGEDLGTLPPGVHDQLTSRGLLGTSVLWFEREAERPKPFRNWRPDALATVTTHDLPTAAGFLAGEHVRVRAALGLLRRPLAEELADAHREREQLIALLEAEGLIHRGAGTAEIISALYAGLTRTPARLLAVHLPDVVGDLRQPNLPGTVDAYPNWRLPVAAPDGHGEQRPLLLEQLLAHPGLAALARVLTTGLDSIA